MIRNAGEVASDIARNPDARLALKDTATALTGHAKDALLLAKTPGTVSTVLAGVKFASGVKQELNPYGADKDSSPQAFIGHRVRGLMDKFTETKLSPKKRAIAQKIAGGLSLIGAGAEYMEQKVESI